VKRGVKSQGEEPSPRNEKTEYTRTTRSPQFEGFVGIWPGYKRPKTIEAKKKKGNIHAERVPEDREKKPAELPRKLSLVGGRNRRTGTGIYVRKNTGSEQIPLNRDQGQARKVAIILGGGRNNGPTGRPTEKESGPKKSLMGNYANSWASGWGSQRHRHGRGKSAAGPEFSQKGRKNKGGRRPNPLWWNTKKGRPKKKKIKKGFLTNLSQQSCRKGGRRRPKTRITGRGRRERKGLIDETERKKRRKTRPGNGRRSVRDRIVETTITTVFTQANRTAGPTSTLRPKGTGRLKKQKRGGGRVPCRGTSGGTGL